MKPCACHRQSLALLASSSLEAAQANTVRQHLEGCAGCREYFAQLTDLCEMHATAARELVSPDWTEPPPAQPAPARRRPPATSSTVDWLAWGQRVLLAGGAIAAVLVIAYGPGSWRGRPTTPPVRTATRTMPAPSAAASTLDTGPRLIRYRLALSRSMDDFDRLLAREGLRAGSGGAEALRPNRASLEADL